MAVAEFETLAEQEAAEIMEWRFSQLPRSGFPADDAIKLATRLDVDLHQAADLVAQGLSAEPGPAHPPVGVWTRRSTRWRGSQVRARPRAAVVPSACRRTGEHANSHTRQCEGEESEHDQAERCHVRRVAHSPDRAQPGRVA